MRPEWWSGAERDLRGASRRLQDGLDVDRAAWPLRRMRRVGSGSYGVVWACSLGGDDAAPLLAVKEQWVVRLPEPDPSLPRELEEATTMEDIVCEYVAASRAGALAHAGVLGLPAVAGVAAVRAERDSEDGRRLLWRMLLATQLAEGDLHHWTLEAARRRRLGEFAHWHGILLQVLGSACALRARALVVHNDLRPSNVLCDAVAADAPAERWTYVAGGDRVVGRVRFGTGACLLRTTVSDYGMASVDGFARFVPQPRIPRRESVDALQFMASLVELFLRCVVLEKIPGARECPPALRRRCDTARRPLLWWIVNVARVATSEDENDAIVARPSAVARGVALYEEAAAARGLAGGARAPPEVLPWLERAYAIVYRRRPACPTDVVRLVCEAAPRGGEEGAEDGDGALGRTCHLNLPPAERGEEHRALQDASGALGLGIWRLGRGGVPSAPFSRQCVDRHYTPDAASRGRHPRK